MMQVEANHHELLFETPNATLHQCDTSELYILAFKGNELLFRPCEFIAFRRKMQQLDILPMLSSDAPDIEIIYMPHCDRVLALSLHEILEIKELFAGAFVMLELNSMIHKEIIRKSL